MIYMVGPFTRFKIFGCVTFLIFPASFAATACKRRGGGLAALILGCINFQSQALFAVFCLAITLLFVQGDKADSFRSLISSTV
jgi:hypothetical protein